MKYYSTLSDNIPLEVTKEIYLNLIYMCCEFGFSYKIEYSSNLSAYILSK